MASEPIKADVLKSLYRRDGVVVTGIRFTYESGATHTRFLLSGLWPEDERDISRFTSELIRIAQEISPTFRDSAGREMWTFIPERSWLAEFIDLTPAELGQAGLDSVTLLDRDLNCVLHLLNGQPLASETTPYDDVRGDVSVAAVVTDVDLPRDYERLDVRALNDTMQTIVRTAVEVYDQWLRLLVCFRDGGPRLLLTFGANVPSGATTVLLNIESIEREVRAGFSLENLKKAVDVIHY